MPTPSDPTPRVRGPHRTIPRLLALLLALAGCGGEPSRREIQNARAFEALLSAVAMRNASELEKDAKVIARRHEEGELSHGKYDDLQEIITKARSGDWEGAEARAYQFRKPFGDRGSFFR